MSSEYIRFESQELLNGQRALLESQVNFLNSLKNLGNYKKLRNEQFNLKIGLKTKLEALQQELIILDKTLPHTSNSSFQSEEERFEQSVMHKEQTSIEKELEEIQNKLKSMQ